RLTIVSLVVPTKLTNGLGVYDFQMELERSIAIGLHLRLIMREATIQQAVRKRSDSATSTPTTQLAGPLTCTGLHPHRLVEERAGEHLALLDGEVRHDFQLPPFPEAG